MTDYKLIPASSVPVPTVEQLAKAWDDARWTREFREGTDIDQPFDKMEGIRAIHALLTKGRGGEGV